MRHTRYKTDIVTNPKNYGCTIETQYLNSFGYCKTEKYFHYYVVNGKHDEYQLSLST